MRRRLLLQTLVLSAALLGMGCSAGSGSVGSSAAPVEDSSASGAAASEVGGALENSSPNGTVSMRSPIHKQNLFFTLLPERAFASSNSCPTIYAASGCSVTANVATLTYADCTFGASTATWTGLMALSSANASTTLTCGIAPGPGTDSLQRQFVAGNGSPATVSRTSAMGRTVIVDDTQAGIQANYQTDLFNGSAPSHFTYTYFNGGGGKSVHFTSGARDSVTIAENLSVGSVLNHTVAGAVSVAETGTGLNTSWTANAGTVTSGSCTGGMTVYHNLAKMMGSTCFSSVVYNNFCCTPVSGSITTTFAKTSASPMNVLTSVMNGRSETLTFSGCGSASYSDYAGNVSTVVMGSCF